MRASVLLCVVLLACAAPAFAQQAKPLQLDLHDPAIVEVRDIWRTVTDATSSGALTREFETGDCSERTRWRDRAGDVRLYVEDGGTGDSAYRVRQYYDTQHRLRFIHATARAVNDASYENRVWIGERGEVLRDDFKSEGQWVFMNFGDSRFWTLDPDNVELSECH